MIQGRLVQVGGNTNGKQNSLPVGRQVCFEKVKPGRF